MSPLCPLPSNAGSVVGHLPSWICLSPSKFGDNDTNHNGIERRRRPRPPLCTPAGSAGLAPHTGGGAACPIDAAGTQPLGIKITSCSFGTGTLPRFWIGKLVYHVQGGDGDGHCPLDDKNKRRLTSDFRAGFWGQV